MIRKLTLALLLTLPTMAMAIDLEGYYIRQKAVSLKHLIQERRLSIESGTGFFVLYKMKI